jgi:hypothetical protein
MSPPRSERADQVVVEAGEGAELLLSLVRADGSRASLLLGAGEAVALAAELLNSLDSGGEADPCDHETAQTADA